MYFIIKSVLELSVLKNALNSHVGFFMVGFKIFFCTSLYLKKEGKLISNGFIRGPIIIFFILSSPSLLLLVRCCISNFPPSVVIL